MITISLFLISCSEQTDKLMRRTANNLKSTKSLSYHVDNLTIEGQSIGDTIFTNVFAIFEKYENDTFLGYKFLIEKSLIHPRFLIPIVLRDHYDGINHTWTLESEVRNDRTITERNAIEKAFIQNKVVGHIPLIIDLLTNNGYDKVSAIETKLEKEECLQLNYYDPDSVAFQLYLSVENELPILLRIVINKEQPFIQEYYYKDFHFANITQLPTSLEYSEDNSTEIHPIMLGDTIPEWNLETIAGSPFHFNEQKGKASLIFLSGIFCRACREQIPTTKIIYERYSKRKDIDVFGFYPYDTKERLNLYTQENDIDYPIIYNSITNSTDRWSLLQKLKLSIPTLILLNNENEILWMKSGFNPSLSDSYLKDLDNMINKFYP